MRSKLIRPLALLALILIEGLLLGVAYDTDSLAQLPPGWWSHILPLAGRAMPIAAAIATGGLLLARRTIAHRLRGISFTPTIPQSLLFLTLQLHSFIWLYLLSAQVFGPTNFVMHHPGICVATWIASAALTGLLWLATLLPPQTILAILRQAWGLLLGCAAVGVAAYLFGVYTQNWWKPLRGSTLNCAYLILHAADSSAWVDSSQYQIGAGKSFGVEVGRQCSGYEGIGLIWVFLLGYFLFFRKELRFPRALLLLPLATVAAWCANTLRIAALVEIGAHASPQIALGGFHSYAGILLVSAIALSTGGIAHRSPVFNRTPRETTRQPNPAAPWLAPFLAVLLVAMITAIFKTTDLDPLYFARILAAAAVLWHYRSVYKKFDPRLSALSAPLGLAVFIIWIYAARATTQPTAATSTPTILWLITRTIGSILIAPIVEELAFRGYLARRFISAEFQSISYRHLSIPAILLSAIAFAATHGSGFNLQFLAAIIAGIAYATIAKRTGRLIDAILAHATTNAFLTIYVITTHTWTLWG